MVYKPAVTFASVAPCTLSWFTRYVYELHGLCTCKMIPGKCCCSSISAGSIWRLASSHPDQLFFAFCNSAALPASRFHYATCNQSTARLVAGATAASGLILRLRRLPPEPTFDLPCLQKWVKQCLESPSGFEANFRHAA